MKYYVYTDGAYSIPTHVAAYAYFIRTEKKCLLEYQELSSQK